MQDNESLPSAGDAARAKCILNVTQVGQLEAALHLSAVVSILSLFARHYQSITQKRGD